MSETNIFAEISPSDTNPKLWAHYTIKKIKDMEFVRNFFKDMSCDPAFSMNWILLSTSGVHGSGKTLDELEAAWDLSEDSPEHLGHDITILIIQPRLCNLFYGHVDIEREDIPFLRNLVESTIMGIEATQVENVQNIWLGFGYTLRQTIAERRSRQLEEYDEEA